MKPFIRTALAIACALAAGTMSAQAQLHTNEADIADATRAGPDLAIDEPTAVLAYVLGQLPERVKVLPTENYYYFRFLHKGQPYTGNIRLSVVDRDEGKLHFAYGEQPSDWRTQFDVRHVVLDAASGVTVTKVENLVYRVSHGGKDVTFALNDLSQVKPPEGMLGADERFIGPVFDESGVRFFLVFNTKLTVFHYVLDETAPVPDVLFAARGNDRIQIGKRTGFAFYQDGTRKILIGVNERNSQLNTPFDGPFDQLPDNFIEGDTLRDAILAVDHGLKDRIDRFGHLTDGRDRYLIHPYLLYRREADLAVFHRCMTHKRVKAEYRPRCFVIGEEETRKRNPLPMGLKRR